MDNTTPMNILVVEDDPVYASFVADTLRTAGLHGDRLPAEFACEGADVSPPLSWSSVPDGTTHFVLIAHDVDQAVGQGTDDMLHWMVWNIPGSTRALPEGVPPGAELPDKSRQISGTGPYYRGPGAPASGPPHHYVFEIYALDAPIDVPAVGQPPPLTRAAVETAMVGKIRARGTLVGLFKR